MSVESSAEAPRPIQPAGPYDVEPSPRDEPARVPGEVVVELARMVREERAEEPEGEARSAQLAEGLADVLLPHLAVEEVGEPAGLLERGACGANRAQTLGRDLGRGSWPLQRSSGSVFADEHA